MKYDDMAVIRAKIDRDGEYRPRNVPEHRGKQKCDNCGFGSRRLKSGLCPYCQHALGVKNAPGGGHS